MICVEFTEQEALVLRNLLDLAVRHPDGGGMRVAESAVVIDRKLLEAGRAAAARETEGAVRAKLAEEAKQAAAMGEGPRP